MNAHESHSVEKNNNPVRVAKLFGTPKSYMVIRLFLGSLVIGHCTGMFIRVRPEGKFEGGRSSEVMVVCHGHTRGHINLLLSLTVNEIYR